MASTTTDTPSAPSTIAFTPPSPTMAPARLSESTRGHTDDQGAEP